MEPKLGFSFEDALRVGIVKKADVEDVAAWLKEKNLPDYSNERITQFLLSCDGNCDAAKDTIRSYVEITNSSDEIFGNRNVKRIDLKKYLNVGEICSLSDRTDDGCVIIFNRLVDYDYRNFDMGAYFTVVAMTIESAIYDYPANGLILVFDVFGMSFMHLTCLRFGLVKIFARYLQEAIPVKLKKMYLINATSVIGRVLGAVRPFVKKEVMDKIETHLVAEMDYFYTKCLPKRFLPVDYGGDMLPFQVLHKQQIEKFKALGTYFASEEKQRKSIRK